jgi:hypothetical protein
LSVPPDIRRRLLDLEAQIDAITSGTTAITNLTASNIKDSTRAYAAGVRSTAQSINTGGPHIIQWDSPATLDSRSAITPGASWKYTVQSGHGGIYWISSCITLVGNGADTGYAFCQLFVNNGSSRLLGFEPAPINNTDTQVLAGGAMLSLAAGDYIDFRVGHGNATARSLNNNGVDNHFSIIRLVSDL